MTTVKALIATCAVALVIYTAVASDHNINRATFNDDGSVQVPKNYHKWVHVGTPVTPHGLNDGEAPFPEFHNVYVEPTAFDHYLRTGTWAEGTQIIKERTLVLKGDNCDEKIGACSEVSGTGYFPGEFKGLEFSTKDTQRFPDEPGGWVYYSFGNNGKPFSETAKPFPTAKCNTCHGSVAKSDFVFTQFYPILRNAKKDK